MSLINQMLQDLEARRASDAELTVLPRHARALPRESKLLWPWWFAVTLAVLGVGGAMAWHFTEEAPRRAEVPAATTQAAPPHAGPARDVETPMPQDTARGAPIPAFSVIARDSTAPRAVTAPAPASAKPRAEPAVLRAAAAKPVATPPAITSMPAKAATKDVPAAVDTPVVPANVEKRAPQPTALQLAEAEYREGTNLLHQGRAADAQEKFRLTLQHSPGHSGARQALAGLLLEANRLSEAELVLQEGLRTNSAQPTLVIALARIQVARGQTATAIESLEKGAAFAGGNADYTAFLAALLQRQGRHAEAVEHYQSALSLAPGNAVWSMGLGISLQALNRQPEARIAYRQALTANTLAPDLQAFIDQQLNLLQ